jgi:hypothetical protein
MGIGDYRDSEFTLEGRDAPALFTIYYDHMPCDAKFSYCTLTRDIRGIDRVASVSDSIQVAGCGDH